MNDPKSSLQAVESLLSAVNAHARDLNDKVLPPDGDSYNELLHLVTDQLNAILGAAQGITADPAPDTASAVAKATQVCGSPVAIVLDAIIGRLSLGNLRSILQASECCTQEQLNGNANSQQIAGKALSAAILRGVESMVASDRQHLELLLAPQA